MAFRLEPYQTFLRYYSPPTPLRRSSSLQICSTTSLSSSSTFIVYVLDLSVTRPQHEAVMSSIRSYHSDYLLTRPKSCRHVQRVFVRSSDQASSSSLILPRTYYFLTDLTTFIPFTDYLEDSPSFSSLGLIFLRLAEEVRQLHELDLVHKAISGFRVVIDDDSINGQCLLGLPGFGHEWLVEALETSEEVRFIDPFVFDRFEEEEEEEEEEGESNVLFQFESDLFAFGRFFQFALFGGQSNSFRNVDINKLTETWGIENRESIQSLITLSETLTNEEDQSQRPKIENVIQTLSHLFPLEFESFQQIQQRERETLLIELEQRREEEELVREKERRKREEERDERQRRRAEEEEDLKRRERELGSIEGSYDRIRTAIIGDGNVGKTALVKRFISGTFEADAEYVPTIEDSYQRDLILDSGESTTIQVLDSAGAEEYSALRDSFMRDHESFLLVFSAIDRNSFESIPEYANHARMVNRSDDLKFILVCNKIDLRDEYADHVTKEEGMEMAERIGAERYVETSAKQDDRVDDAFREATVAAIKQRQDYVAGVSYDACESYDDAVYASAPMMAGAGLLPCPCDCDCEECCEILMRILLYVLLFVGCLIVWPIAVPLCICVMFCRRKSSAAHDDMEYASSSRYYSTQAYSEPDEQQKTVKEETGGPSRSFCWICIGTSILLLPCVTLPVLLIYVLILHCCQSTEESSSSNTPAETAPEPNTPGPDLHQILQNPNPIPPNQEGLQRKQTYDVTKVLGQGGQSSVYLVSKDDQTYVMKRYKSGTEGEFECETAALSRFDHDHIVRMIEHFTFVDEYGELQRFIILEYADGVDLQKKLRRLARRKKEMSKEMLESYLLQLALGVVEMHSKRIVHHDLKPANIFTTRNGGLLIGDLGFALEAGAESIGVSGGTPPYMSPQQASGEIARLEMDIWALGTIFFEMSTTQLVDFKKKTSAQIQMVVEEGLLGVDKQVIRGAILGCLKETPEDRLDGLGLKKMFEDQRNSETETVD